MTSKLIFDPPTLKALMERQLAARNVNPESIFHVVTALLETSLRGVDSHGINLFPHYCRALDAGRINASPNIKVRTRHPSAIVLDADHGFGHHAGSTAMALAVEAALQTGIATVSVRNSTHFGAAAYYALQASRKGFLAFSFTNADSLVKAPGSRTPYFGTNPICFTAPMENEDPLCLDMATSLVSWNTVQEYKRKNSRVPGDWGFSSEGRPTDDPGLIAMLNPIGGYKGFGLGMMVEILCGLLTSGPYAHQLLPMFARLEKKRYISHFFGVIDIGKYTDPAGFMRRLYEMAATIRNLPPLEGTGGAMVPGDPEKKAFKERSRSGIPIDETRYTDFLSLSNDFTRALKP